MGADRYHYDAAGSSIGTILVKLFNTADGSSADDTVGGEGNQEAGNAPETSVKFGKSRFGTWSTDVWLDDIVANAATWPGPVAGEPQVLSMQAHVFGHNMW